MKKLIALALSLMMLFSLCAGSLAEEKTTFKVGICNFLDHASLNQIIASIRERLGEIEQANNVVFDIREDNCNMDGSIMQQIIANFIADDVDLMVGVATPVAMTMQGMTEDNRIPVVFAAVSDPVDAGLVDSLEAPGANITGTSDSLNTQAVFDLIFAANPDIEKVALLYSPSERASIPPIAEAIRILSAKGVAYQEYTGATIADVQLAAEAIAADGMQAVFTPTDNTIMGAELAIYETFADAKIPHYAGADSFALNGAFVGYGVDYIQLGHATADIIADILLNGADPAQTPVKLLDNGIATVNTEICQALGYDYDEIAARFSPLCAALQTTVTAENFDDLDE